MAIPSPSDLVMGEGHLADLLDALLHQHHLRPKHPSCRLLVTLSTS